MLFCSKADGNTREHNIKNVPFRNGGLEKLNYICRYYSQHQEDSHLPLFHVVTLFNQFLNGAVGPEGPVSVKTYKCLMARSFCDTRIRYFIY